MSPKIHGSKSGYRHAIVLTSRNRGNYATAEDIYSRNEIGQAVSDIQSFLGLSDEDLAAQLGIVVDTLERLKLGHLVAPRALKRLIKMGARRRDA